MTWFLDGGAHQGESIRMARSLLGATHFVAFEPAAECWENLQAEGALLVPAALWTSPGRRLLYLADRTASHTLIAEKLPEPKGTVFVPTVSLCPYLRALPDGEALILKLDIEGAEYDVLEQALDERMLRWVGTLYVDFHADRIPGFPKERHNRLVSRLLEQGFKLEKWWPIEGRIETWGEKWLLP